MRRVMLRRSGCRQALVVTSIYLLLGGISHADIHGNDSRADPICYDTITGTTAFTRTSKAVGTFHNRGEVFDQDGNLTPNQLHLCAAFLISPENHVLTNAHCLATTATRREMQLVFGGQAVGCGSSTVTSHETYSLTENDLILELPELDMALFQISSGDPAVEDGFGWLRLDPDTRLTNIWWSPGFNEGVIGPPGGKRTIFLPTTGIEEDITDNNPKVAWDGDCEVTNVPRDCSETQDRLDAMTEGLWTSPPNACLTHACDASPGSSGAPILDTPSVKVIGINTGVTGGIGTNDGYAIKIRNIWPRINHLIDVRDSDEDGLPDVRDNCDFEPNTGSCTSGRIGFGCFVDSNCDTFLVADGSMGDGICEGSQVDFDGDGVGDICETLPPDAFEDNDLPLQAATLAAGHYNLTIDERFDEDFFSFTNTAASRPRSHQRCCHRQSGLPGAGVQPDLPRL